MYNIKRGVNFTFKRDTMITKREIKKRIIELSCTYTIYSPQRIPVDVNDDVLLVSYS